MNHLLRLLGSLAVLLTTAALAAPPIPAPDAYSTPEDTPLLVPASGVLGNDNLNGHPQIEAFGATTPAHGTLTLNADGSFLYTPAGDYSGPDYFTYRARNLIGPLAFAINPALTTVNLSARIRGSGIDQTRSDTSRLSGTVTVGLLDPKTTGPFNLIRITDLDAVLIDALELNYNFSILGTAKMTAAANAITVSLDAAGPAAPVNAAGQFSQTGNTGAADGIVHVTYNILLVGSGDSDQSLNHATAPTDFNNASIVSDGTTMTLTLPLDFTRNGVVVNEDPLITADIHITGTIKATAPAAQNVAQESTPATVTLTVNPVNDPPVALADSYYTRQGFPLVVSATPSVNSEELVAAGSTWKYRYDGTDPGATWKEWFYDDSTWLSGPAQLGFGDPEIVTNIRPGATPNHPTAFFRREFMLTNVNNTRPGVKLYVKRDDGAVVYLNGTEIYRDANVPAGADFDDNATSQRPDAEENVFVEVTVSRALLFEGKNVLAAEVHQFTGSGDLRFDARFTRETGIGGLLANDTDVDSPPASLSTILLDPPAHGSVQLGTNGAFNYTPAAGYVGTDSFAYRVIDGQASTTPQILLPAGSTWKYLADGSNQGTAWRASAFDDSTWLSGPAELGYGDDADGRPEATNIRPDPGAQPIHATYYFRTKFTYNGDKAFVSALTGAILRDDLAAVYLNGALVFRDPALPQDAAFDFYTTTGTPSETAFATFNIPLNQLLAGENTLAVEVHQSGPTSSDVSFDFQLTATILPGARATITVLTDDADSDGMSDAWERANGFNYLSAADAAQDADGDGAGNRLEFLAGTNPQNSTEYLRPGAITLAGGNLHLTFHGLNILRTYQLESTLSLNPVVWSTLGAPLDPTTPSETIIIPFPIADPQRYYRLRVNFTFP